MESFNQIPIKFHKGKVNTLTLLITFIAKNLQKEVHWANLLLSVGISLQSPQSTTTPKILTLGHGIGEMTCLKQL